jgi:hypothetical protein
MLTIAAVARKLNVAPRALFLAFARELPGAHPVLGCETDAQLESLLGDWESHQIDAAAMTQLVESLPTLRRQRRGSLQVGANPNRRSNAIGNQKETASVATATIASTDTIDSMRV